MKRRRPPFWSSLFRNRRNNACCACVVLVGFFAVLTLVWAGLSISLHILLEIPPRLLALAGIVAGLKGWKDHVDARPSPENSVPPAP